MVVFKILPVDKNEFIIQRIIKRWWHKPHVDYVSLAYLGEEWRSKARHIKDYCAGSAREILLAVEYLRLQFPSATFDLTEINTKT